MAAVRERILAFNCMSVTNKPLGLNTWKFVRRSNIDMLAHHVRNIFHQPKIANMTRCDILVLYVASLCGYNLSLSNDVFISIVW